MKRAGLVVVALCCLTAGSCGGDSAGSAKDHVTLNECLGDASTYHQANLAIVNKGSNAADYEVAVAFISTKTGNQLKTGLARVRALAAGQRTVATARNPELFGVAARCEIVDVVRVGR
jgi:hypothetical protein